MKKILFLSFALVISMTIFGQVSFRKDFKSIDGGALAIMQTSDGGYVIGGRIWKTLSWRYNPVLVKISATGDSLWEKEIPVSFAYGEPDFKITPDDGVVISCPYINGKSTLNSILIRVNSIGDTLWTKVLTDFVPYSVEVPSLLEIDILGRHQSINSSIIVKMDGNGNTIWEKDLVSVIYATTFCRTADDGYALAGYPPNSYNVWQTQLVKTNSNGDVTWSVPYLDYPEMNSFCIHQTSDNGYIICGSAADTGVNSSSFAFIIKADNTGQKQWLRTYTTGEDQFSSILATQPDGYIVCGHGKIDTNRFAVLEKIGSSGSPTWRDTFQIGTDTYANSVLNCTDGGYIFAGGYYFSPNDGDSIAMVIKTDANGVLSVPAKNFTPLQKLVLYPEPCNEFTCLQYSLIDPGSNEGYLEIYNVNGQRIKNIPMTSAMLKRGNYKLDTHDLNPGQYFLKLRSGQTTLSALMIKVE